MSDAKLLSAPVSPGGTIGILGGGQLGRMLAMAAARLGLRTHVYCADMEIDIIPASLLTDLGLPPQLERLLDRDLQSVIQRSAAMCGAVNTSK